MSSEAASGSLGRCMVSAGLVLARWTGGSEDPTVKNGLRPWVRRCFKREYTEDPASCLGTGLTACYVQRNALCPAIRSSPVGGV